jgi:hypothetical protein
MITRAARPVFCYNRPEPEVTMNTHRTTPSLLALLALLGLAALACSHVSEPGFVSDDGGPDGDADGDSDADADSDGDADADGDTETESDTGYKAVTWRCLICDPGNENDPSALTALPPPAVPGREELLRLLDLLVVPR